MTPATATRRATYPANRGMKTTSATKKTSSKKGVPPARPGRDEDPRANLRFADHRVEPDDGYLLSTLPREVLNEALATGEIRIPGRLTVRLNGMQREIIGRLVLPAMG